MITFKSKNGRLGEVMCLSYGLFYFCIKNDIPLDQVFIDEDYVGTDFYEIKKRYVVKDNLPLFKNISKYLKKTGGQNFYKDFIELDRSSYDGSQNIEGKNWLLANYWHTPYNAALFKLLFKPKELFNRIRDEHEKEMEFGNAWSCHVRRGDFILIEQSKELSSKYTCKTPAPLALIESKLKTIPAGQHAVIFSDDIQWCKDNLGKFSNVVFSSCQHEYEDMICISLCKNHICLNNSIFNICAVMLSDEYNGRMW